MPRIAIAVNDFDGIVTLFRDQLGMPVIDISQSSVDSLGARLAMCVPPGGSNIELMCPADPAAPLSQSLQRFLDRRGEGLFALMLEAPVPNDEADVLLERGLQVLPLMEGAGGRDIHPRSTHGVLIRVYPVDSFQGRMEPTHDALALSGINRVMIAVQDIDRAMTVYGPKLGMRVDPAISHEDSGIRSAICHPPSGGVIELVSVEDEQRPLAKSIGASLQSRGEGMFALVLQTENLQQTAEVMSQRGLNPAMATPNTIELAPADTFGARLIIEAA